MTVFIVRHAHAVDAEEDPERPLSKRGRKQVQSLATFLKPTNALQTDEVWHSPLARSRETAELLVRGLGLDAKLMEVDGLQSEDDPAIVARKLQTRRKPLVIVGHEPHLSALASLLVAGVREPPRFTLKKCSVLAVEQVDDHWSVCWQVSPEIVQ